MPLLLSVIVSEPVRLPSAVGVNVTLIVQLAPAATELPQVLVWAKSSPPTVMLLISSAPLPELVRVTVCRTLGVPISWSPKFTLVVERVTWGNATRNPYALMFPIKGLLRKPVFVD